MPSDLELTIEDAVDVAGPKLALTNIHAFAKKFAEEMSHGVNDPRGYYNHVYQAVIDSLQDDEELQENYVAEALIDEGRIMWHEDWDRDVLMDYEEKWTD